MHISQQEKWPELVGGGLIRSLTSPHLLITSPSGSLVTFEGEKTLFQKEMHMTLRIHSVLRTCSIIVAAVIFSAAFVFSAQACTRALYVGDDNLVVTGRSLDWPETMDSELWVFPRGMDRDGAAGPESITWTSKYGSLIVSTYESGSIDGMNEKGLVMNGLYLVESDYGPPDNRSDQQHFQETG